MRYSVKANPRRRNHRHFLSNEFDVLFNELFKAQPAKKRFVQKSPAVNVIEEEAAFKLEIAIPGLSKEDVSLKIEEETLVISAGQVKAEVKEETTEAKVEAPKVNYTLKEFDYTSFTRRFQLNDKIDKEAIAANFENGILRIVLPKIKEDETLKNRVIEIK